jgi:hypothetical protein
MVNTRVNSRSLPALRSGRDDTYLLGGAGREDEVFRSGGRVVPMSSERGHPVLFRIKGG